MSKIQYDLEHNNPRIYRLWEISIWRNNNQSYFKIHYKTDLM